LSVSATDPWPANAASTVDQQRNALCPISIAEGPLLGPDPAFDHWIDRFQVARVGREREVNLVAFGRLEIAGEAEVVLTSPSPSIVSGA